MAPVKFLENPLTHMYMAHAALLAVKLLALSPIASLSWLQNAVFPGHDYVRRAYLSELNNIAPFWFVGALYVTTSPPADLTIILFRAYTAARLLGVVDCVKPAPAVMIDLATVTSYAITCYMCVCVVYYYKNFL